MEEAMAGKIGKTRLKDVTKKYKRNRKA